MADLPTIAQLEEALRAVEARANALDIQSVEQQLAAFTRDTSHFDDAVQRIRSASSVEELAKIAPSDVGVAASASKKRKFVATRAPVESLVSF